MLYGYLTKIRKWHARRKKRLDWEAKWSRDDFRPAWGDRGVAPEIMQTMDDGWLPARGTVLDIGCGLGEIAAWFAERGYKSIAIDISTSAVRKGRELNKELPLLEYLAMDICAVGPPNQQYDIIVDRGCLHQLRPDEVPAYVANVAAVSGPNAKMLLFVKAFRDGIPLNDPEERESQIQWIREVFANSFDIEQVATTFLDKYYGKVPHRRLPGLFFRLSRAA